jgi:hypothetical protein
MLFESSSSACAWIVACEQGSGYLDSDHSREMGPELSRAGITCRPSRVRVGSSFLSLFSFHILTTLHRHGKKLVLQVDDLYPHFRTALLSHQQKLRALVLRLLSTKAVQKSPATDTIKGCLQAEDVSLDVQGVRERVLRINRLGQHVQINDCLSAEICARWLTGTNLS